MSSFAGRKEGGSAREAWINNSCPCKNLHTTQGQLTLERMCVNNMYMITILYNRDSKTSVFQLNLVWMFDMNPTFLKNVIICKARSIFFSFRE